MVQAPVLRVLLVEDSPEFAYLVERHFSADGVPMTMRCVETMAAFLAAVQECMPHVIVSDYVLPDTSGVAVLEAARRVCPLVPVVIVSGVVGDDIAVDVLKRGAADFVAKSNSATLVARVHRALQEAAEQRERAALEARVRERDAYFYSLVESSPDGMMVVEPAGRIVMVNTEGERMFGYSPGELIGQSVDVLIPPRFGHHHGDRLRHFVSATGKRSMRKGMDVPAVRKSGEEFHASIALSPVETTEGLQAVATVRDLTESMALRTEVGHARAQLDTMPESIVLLDSDGRLTYVNEEWRRDARRVGAPTAHITGVGLTYLDVARLPDSHSQQIMDGLSDVLAGRSAHFAAVYPCHEPDDLRWCRFVARAVDSDHGAALVTRVDCSEAHLATARSRVQDAIARSLATGLSLPDICSHLVDAVLVELGWQVGAVWVPEVSGTEQALQRTLLRVAPEAAAIDVETTPQPGPLAPGVGLPGRVWASLRPEWAADIATPAHLPDQAPLPAVRLRTGFAFPLLIESETLAVVEFYSDHPRKRDDALLSVLASAGRQVGDIVRRRRAESVREATLEELHRVQERLDTVLKAAPASILMIDRDGSVEFASRPLLETPTDALVGLSWVEVFPAEHRDAAAAAFERVRRSGSSELFEAPLAAAHGAQLWFQNHLAPVKCGADVVGAVVVSQDISDKRRIESELATTQRLAAVGSLAAGVAHEINTPIQFVGDSITFLREAMLDIFRLIEQLRAVRQSVQEGTPSLETADSASRLEDEIDLDYLKDNMPAACDRSADGIHRVATIVRAMKEFAHAPGRDMAPADLNRAIGSTLTVAGNEYKLVADVVTDFGDLPLVTCHVSDINQVILNLIVNSAHAIQDVVGDSGRKGTISVQTRLDGDDVVVAVSDTGGGIPAHVLTRMFEPFFTTKEIGRGSGQGLAIAWTIVTDKHAGRIYCESELGIGTTVYVRLPVAGFSSVTRADSEAAGTGAAKLQVRGGASSRILFTLSSRAERL